MPELPALRLCLKNTFLDIMYDDSENTQGEVTPDCRSVVTVGNLEGSPMALRSKSAGCTPRDPEEGLGKPPLTVSQLQRLNLLLLPCADKNGKSLEQLKVPIDSCSTAASEAKGYCHKSVPRRVDLRSCSGSGDASNQPTTLMFRNVPNCYTQDDFLSELEEFGFGGAFDFAYLPMDKSSKASVGYAFVNFVSPSCVASLLEGEHGLRFSRHRKNKEVIVCVAHLQGLAANLAHYERIGRKSSKMAAPRPFVSEDGHFFSRRPDVRACHSGGIC